MWVTLQLYKYRKMKLLTLYMLLWPLSYNLQAQSTPGYWGQSRDTLDSMQQLAFKTPVPISKQFIKIGLGLPILRQSSFTGYYKTVAFNVVAERKIVGGLSMLIGLENNFGFETRAKLYSLESPIDLRYYFSIGRRMKQRLDPHSFFSYYVSLHTHNVIFSRLKYSRLGTNGEIDRYKRGELLNQQINYGLIKESLNLLGFAYFQLGVQHRIFNKSFFDINVVLPAPFLVYNKWDYSISSPALVNITFGQNIGR